MIWNAIAVPYKSCIKGKVIRSSRQDFSPNAGTYQEDEYVSSFGKMLMSHCWLPAQDGGFTQPGNLSLEDLPEAFVRDERLADELGMKKDSVAKLAEEAGIPTEDIDLLRKYPGEFAQWKAQIVARGEKPDFPTRRVTNPERRQEHLAQQFADAPEKQYEEQEGSVRTSRGAVEPALWLRQQYTNNAGQMVCQICREVMPFKKRDGDYYFEAVEALSREYFTKEHEVQYLALCPLCAAMFVELTKKDATAMGLLEDELRTSESHEIPLTLAGIQTSIRFVDAHLFDIKTILAMEDESRL